MAGLCPRLRTGVPAGPSLAPGGDCRSAWLWVLGHQSRVGVGSCPTFSCRIAFSGDAGGADGRGLDWRLSPLPDLPRGSRQLAACPAALGVAWCPLAAILGPPAVLRAACCVVAECHGVCWSSGFCSEVSVGDVVVVAPCLGPAHCPGWAAGAVCRRGSCSAALAYVWTDGGPVSVPGSGCLCLQQRLPSAFSGPMLWRVCLRVGIRSGFPVLSAHPHLVFC